MYNCYGFHSMPDPNVLLVHELLIKFAPTS